MTLIHCKNSLCKYNWQDSCTIALQSRMLILDEDGKCEDQEEKE